MTITRRSMRAAFIVTVALFTSCAPMRAAVAGANRVQCALNPSPPERRQLDHIESACGAGSIVWIVPVVGGVVLVDAGFEESGDSIARALHGRRVLAILLTHGHIDHRAAAHRFHAPVYVGRGDLDLVAGTRASIAIGARFGDVLGVPPAPRVVIPVDDGFVLTVGMRMFRAIALPGHTPGSTGWMFGRALFSGDALQGPNGDAIFPAPSYVTDDYQAAYASFRKLRDVDIDVILDGHFGRTASAKRKIREALERKDKDGTEQPFFRPAGCSS